MSISFGSTGIKPYVGSKEVQEAYVGSTLVYRAGPGSNYAFLGTADGYYLAKWCTYENAVIEQESGIYKMSLNKTTQGRGKISLDISDQNKYTILKFTGKCSGGSSLVLKMSVDGGATQNITLTNKEKEFSVAVKANAQSIVISNNSASYSALLNNIYLE